MIKVAFGFFFIQRAFSHKGFVDDVLIDTKVVCPVTAKEVFTVKSEIQCTHRCLRKKCKMLNYYMKEGTEENCEVFTGTDECSTAIDQLDWKAVSFLVRLFQEDFLLLLNGLK